MTGPTPRSSSSELDLGPRDADIVDPDTYVRGVPHATFRRLRRDDPVSWWDEPDGQGFWAVTRHDDLKYVSRHVEEFSSAQGVTLEEMDESDFTARRNMLEYDPPAHTRYRRLVAKPFSRRSVYAYETAIRSLARSVVDDALAPGGTVTLDFVSDIAKQLPMRMLGRLLGVDDADGPWLVERGDALLGNFDPDFTDFPVGLTDTDEYKAVPFRSPAALELFHYAEAQADQRRRHPTHDVINDLLAPMIDGDRLTDQEFKNFFVLLVSAGNDTTRYTMASSMKALIERPDQMEMLREAIGRGDEAFVETAVEELIRWGSVTMHFRRTATRDTELRGRTIRAGDKVVIWFVSADYDESVFANPYHLDLRRDPNPQVAFGLTSPHLCLGAQLARMEIKVLFQELLPRLTGAQITGPLERMRSNFIAGIKRLPVALTVA